MSQQIGKKGVPQSKGTKLLGGLVTSQSPTPCSSWQQQPTGIAKPRYLEQLENYLRKELLLLDLGTDSAQELRLQVRVKTNS